MSPPNFDLLLALSRAWPDRQSVTLTVDTGRVKRSLHIRGGAFIGADSDVTTERLGVLLVAEGLLDVTRIEPVVQACRQSGRTFGEQLIADGTVAREVVARTLVNQAQARFDRALQTRGTVIMEGLRPIEPVFERPLGPLLLDGFRQRFSLAFCSSVVASLPPGGVKLTATASTLAALGLSSEEQRYLQQLASGQGLTSVLDRARDPELALRLAAALVGLGLLRDGAPAEDPISALLRMA